MRLVQEYTRWNGGLHEERQQQGNAGKVVVFPDREPRRIEPLLEAGPIEHRSFRYSLGFVLATISKETLALRCCFCFIF